MNIFIRRILFLTLFVLMCGGGGLAYLLMLHIHSQDFRHLAEQEAGRILQSEVRIRDIRIKSVNRILLDNIQIAEETGSEDPFQIQIEKIEFRYNFLQLLTRNLRLPTTISIKAPKLTLDREGLPYEVLANIVRGGSKGGSSQANLRLDGGILNVFIPEVNRWVYLQDIRGTLSAKADQAVAIDLKARIEGDGKVRVIGNIYPAKKDHDLRLILDHIMWEGNSRIPFKDIEGELRWTQGELQLEKLSAKIHGWDVDINGRISRIQNNPLVLLQISAGKNEFVNKISLRADFGSQQINGSTKFLGQQDHFFRGKLLKEADSYHILDLVVDELYKGAAAANLITGSAQVELENDKQRYFLETNLVDLNFNMRFRLDHLQLYGLDIVSSLTVKMTPEIMPGDSPHWKFRGEISTDYLILQFAPFNDFMGTFNITPFGIQNIQAKWGRAFSLNGNIDFLSNPLGGKLVVSVDDYDLSQVEEFASKPLPKELQGKLSGKLKIDGAFKNPEVVGNFNLTEGKIGKLTFDRGIIRFHGFPPYLPLHESRFLKGRMTFNLEGALNLSLKNVFHGVQISTPENIVLWKGWEFNTSTLTGDFEIDPEGDVLPTLSVKPGFETTNSARGEAEGYKSDRYVAIGTKLRF